MCCGTPLLTTHVLGWGFHKNHTCEGAGLIVKTASNTFLQLLAVSKKITFGGTSSPCLWVVSRGSHNKCVVGPSCQLPMCLGGGSHNQLAVVTPQWRLIRLYRGRGGGHPSNLELYHAAPNDHRWLTINKSRCWWPSCQLLFPEDIP